MNTRRTVRAVAAMALSASFVYGCATTPDAGITVCVSDFAGNGLAYIQAGQCLQAEEACLLSLEYGRRNAKALNCLGLVAWQCHQDNRSATRFFRHAVVVDPKYAAAHNNLGASLLRHDPPLLSAACDHFQIALDIDEHYTDARENLAMCSLGAKR